MIDFMAEKNPSKKVDWKLWKQVGAGSILSAALAGGLAYGALTLRDQNIQGATHAINALTSEIVTQGEPRSTPKGIEYIAGSGHVRFVDENNNQKCDPNEFIESYSPVGGYKSVVCEPERASAEFPGLAQAAGYLDLKKFTRKRRDFNQLIDQMKLTTPVVEKLMTTYEVETPDGGWVKFEMNNNDGSCSLLEVKHKGTHEFAWPCDQFNTDAIYNARAVLQNPQARGKYDATLLKELIESSSPAPYFSPPNSN